MSLYLLLLLFWKPIFLLVKVVYYTATKDAADVVVAKSDLHTWVGNLVSLVW